MVRLGQIRQSKLEIQAILLSPDNSPTLTSEPGQHPGMAAIRVQTLAKWGV